MKYYIIAGEASGDLHGANLIRELHRKRSDIEVRCWGGDRMEAAGATLVRHYRDLAFMGFTEVLLNLPTIRRNFRFCKRDILNYAPDALILIDYPGFNLRLVKWARQRGIRVIYYISPQIWAWHRSRVHLIQKWVDRMIVILPFEKEFYAQYGVDVDYVGHPLLDVVRDFRATPGFRNRHKLPKRDLVALLPGSRKQEIARMLPIMLSVVPLFTDCHFVICGAPGQEDVFYQELVGAAFPVKHPANLSFLKDQTYEVLAESQAALVTSGTATLETALFGVPEVVCYKGNPFSFFIARRLVDVPYISLVNLIAGKQIIPELIQQDLQTENLTVHLNAILEGSERTKMKREFSRLKKLLGHSGASEKAAEVILDA